jgi:transglutaminase/protease-like cytokinesis protein 3
MKLIPAMLLLMIPGMIFPQDNEFSEVDSFAGSLQASPDMPVQELTEKLIKPFNNDLDKVRVIFYWIASNIEFESRDDQPGIREDYPSVKEKINDIYYKRRGSCSGYSHLFRYMLDIAGIRSRVINGFARFDMKSSAPVIPNHAWNSVKIEDKWYLCDVTWADDTLDTVNDYWFMTDPEIFIMNHYPVFQSFTLTKEKYSFQDFCQFPIYTRSFHDLKFFPSMSKKGILNAVNDTVTIDQKADETWILSARLYETQNNPKVIAYGRIVRDNEKIRVFIPHKGEFLMKLGALKQGSGSFVIFDELVYYKIINN